KRLKWQTFREGAQEAFMCKILGFVILVLFAPQLLTVRAAASLFAPFANGSQANAKETDDDKDFTEKFLKTFSEPLEIRESKPVTVENSRFVLVAQTNWKPGKPDKTFPMVAPIAIQLHISNLTKREVCFQTFNTFGLRVLTQDGREVKRRGKGKGT